VSRALFLLVSPLASIMHMYAGIFFSLFHMPNSPNVVNPSHHSHCLQNIKGEDIRATNVLGN